MLWIILASLTAVLAACLLHCIQTKGGKKTVKPLPALAAAVVLALIVGVGLLAAGVMNVTGENGDEPGAAAQAFFAAVEDGDFDAAAEHLEYFADLGLSEAPADDSARMVYEALVDSYAYQLAGGVKVNGLHGMQSVKLTHLDVEALNEAMVVAMEDALQHIVDSNKKVDVFDENQQYLPGIREQAYEMALETLLDDPAEYLVTDTLEVQLAWTLSGWKVSADQALLNALSGFAAY